MSPRDLVYVGHMLDMARKAVAKVQDLTHEQLRGGCAAAVTHSRGSPVERHAPAREPLRRCSRVNGQRSPAPAHDHTRLPDGPLEWRDGGGGWRIGLIGPISSRKEVEAGGIQR